SLAMIFEQINPKYGALCLAISGGISAFTKRVHHVGRRKKIPKSFISSVLILSLAGTLAACPSASDLKRAYTASAQIAGNTETAARTIGELYTAGVISYRTKESLVAKLKIVRDNGLRFQAEINALYDLYRDKLPAASINALDIMFNRDVIAPFVELLTEAGILSKEAGAQVLTALILLKSAILTVSNMFGKLRPTGSASFEF